MALTSRVNGVPVADSRCQAVYLGVQIPIRSPHSRRDAGARPRASDARDRPSRLLRQNEACEPRPPAWGVGRWSDLSIGAPALRLGARQSTR